MRRFANEVRKEAEKLADMIARETGKPLWEARTEVGTVAAKVGISITAQAERAGERFGEAAGVPQALRHKPHGVLAVLGPYNFPAHLPNGHIVPALIAGNTASAGGGGVACGAFGCPVGAMLSFRQAMMALT